MTMKSERYLTFYLDSYLFALRVADIREINRLGPSTDADQAFLRDEAIPTFDLRRRLGLEGKPTTDASRLIVFKNRPMKSATLVDSVHGVIDLFADQWESPSAADSLPFPPQSLFSGIASWKGLTVLLLDITQITSAPKAQVIAV